MKRLNKTNVEVGVITYEDGSQLVSDSDDVIFRIQVAASRIPVTKEQLARIYNGHYPVEMIMEEGWYKYQFLGVRLFSDAIRIIRDVKSWGVFIVAYEDGIKQNLAEAVKKNKKLENTVLTMGRKGYLQEIEFHLQIAASRFPLTSNELVKLFGESERISVILDDGWYKYHIKTCNSYQKALKLKQECGIDKAFIVPYKCAKKIALYDATRKTK